jgi:hypothetical protein
VETRVRTPLGVPTVEPQLAARFVSLTRDFLVSGDHLVVSGSCHAVQPMMGRGPEIVPNCAQIVPTGRATIRRLPSCSSLVAKGGRLPPPKRTSVRRTASTRLLDGGLDQAPSEYSPAAAPISDSGPGRGLLSFPAPLDPRWVAFSEATWGTRASGHSRLLVEASPGIIATDCGLGVDLVMLLRELRVQQRQGLRSVDRNQRGFGSAARISLVPAT